MAEEEKIVVPADKPEISKKVKVDLEVDTSVKDLGPNPYAKLIHMARAVDSWRIFPRLFLTVYIILLYKFYIKLDFQKGKICFSCIKLVRVPRGSCQNPFFTFSRKYKKSFFYLIL